MVDALARVCPHCDVRLENVRCGRCWSLQQPGSFSCARCGKPLELEPVLDATDAPCPRCSTPLEAAGGQDARVHECPRCGGAFVSRDELAEMLTRAELEGPFSDPPKPSMSALAEVRYIACPLCHSSMNRLNFGRVSGVIIDVCRPHGTWFDGGELTRVIAFAAGGGLAKTRAREALDQQAIKKEASKVHAELSFLRGSNEAGSLLGRRGDPDALIQEWRDLLRDIFTW